MAYGLEVRFRRCVTLAWRREEGRCSSQMSGFWHRDNKGIAALEAAILVPLVLLPLIFGIIDWGYVFFVDLSLTNAAREGARRGVTAATEEMAVQEAKDAVEAYLVAAGLGTGGLNEVEWDATMENPNLTVKTSIADFEPLIGFLPEAALPSSLSATAVMRWELAPL